MIKMLFIFTVLMICKSVVTTQQFISETDMEDLMTEVMTESEYVYSRMRDKFGDSKRRNEPRQNIIRQGKAAGNFDTSRVWPGGRVPYQFQDTIDHREWITMQLIFSNISSVTNIQFIPRTARDTDYLLVSEDIDKYGCGCCSIGVGYTEGAGEHVLVLAPVSKGGCGVNHIGGMHEILHILGLTHVQNRPDRCNYIDVRTNDLTGWGEWSIGQLTDAADWFKLRIPYDCSSYVHYYQLQGAVWKEEIMKKVDYFMESQGCESFQRGKYINSCLVEGGFTTKDGRILRNGYERCLDKWDTKHKKCVEYITSRYPTFDLVDPNGRCKANGINKSKRKTYELSQWDIWALNAAYDGPLPKCQFSQKVGNGICDPGNNNIGCNYDGGDCCLPQASSKDCIDPCGVRWKFYNGTNRSCRKAPETDNFCRDHYWYGPNRCDQTYCRVTDEKFLQWQCKKKCDLCNTPPVRQEMDEICDGYLPEFIRNKYKDNNKIKLSTTKPKQTSTKPVFTKPNQIKPVSNKPSLTKPVFTKQNQEKQASAKPKPVKSINIKSNEIQISTIQKSPSKKTNSIPKTIPRRTVVPQAISTSIPKETVRASQKENDNKPTRQNIRNNKKKNRKLNKDTRTNKNVKEQPKSSGGKNTGGFVVISSPERRLEMRSYWMRRG